MGLRDKLKARKSVEIEIEGEKCKLVEPSYALSVEVGKGDPATGMAKLIIACLHDTDGKPVYTAGEIDEVKDLPVGYVRQIDLALGELSKADQKKA